MEERRLDYDIVVCGGGLPGVCTAIAAARNHARVALIQDRPVLGGNSSSEAGVPPHGAAGLGHNRMARETGILEELRMEYAACCHDVDNRHFWDLVLRNWCEKETLLDLYLNTRIVSCLPKDKAIDAVHAFQSSTETKLCIHGKIFVDATGDGFIASEAGAEFRIGREAKSEFSESLAPEAADSKTLGSTLYFIACRRDYPVHFAPPSWAKNYSDCSTLPYRPHSIENIIPGNALSADGSTVRLFWWLELGGERDVIKDSEQIYADLLSELMGVWDHLKNHCDEKTKKALEFYDIVFWSLFPLRRESRRVVGDYIMSEKDIIFPELFPDRVAYGGFPIDIHPPEGIRSNDPPCDQTFLNELYNIPYRCLYSRKIKNLFLSGRCISASSVALGSLRVMNTLGAAAQAVGNAAALCIRYNITPRDILKKYMEELQQSLLREDAYIIGFKNSDSDDIARNASIQTSSCLPLLAESTDGYLELAYDIAQQVPISNGQIISIEVFLKSSLPDAANVHWEIKSNSRIGHMEEIKPLLKGSLSVPAGKSSWIKIGGNIKVREQSFLWICLMKHPGIYWGFTKNEAFGTRIAVKYEGPHVPRKFHGRARIAPFKRQWFPINHHGRLPAELETWIAKASDEVSPRKLYSTLNFRINPVQKPYSCANVINGFGRAEDWPNIWISDPTEGLPQSLSLTWPEPQAMRRFILSFDTDLDLEDRMYGFPRDHFRFSFPVPSCVKDYEIAVKINGSWKNIINITDNYHRRRIHELAKAINTDEVRITVLKTNGADTARIYEVRVY